MEILIIFGLIILNGIFALAEIALISARKARLEAQANKGDRRAKEALDLANHPDNNRPGSMGRPVGDVEIRAVDGELWMRGSGIATGYWGHPPFEDGWLKTGDLVEIDADGFVWFRGRKKEIIVRGGSNISPQEVEETLYQHPAVAEAGVIGEPDTYCGEVVLAFVALRNGYAVSAEELIAFSRQHLAEYKCPERVLFLPVLPKGPTGKVQRRALKDLRTEAAAS